MPRSLNITILGLSITSSWGNGHATTYRGLVRALSRRGHHVLFLERDVPWYASQRDMPEPPYGRTVLYSGLEELRDRHAEAVRDADLTIVGSYVPEGVAVGQWATDEARGVVAFYDIDTPVTLAKLERHDHEYIAPGLIPRYDLYLSFTGGPTLKLLEERWGAPMARALYCAVDPELYFPEEQACRYDLGYLGTYSPDRQPTLEQLLIEPARRAPEARFAVAGPQYPPGIEWPANVERIEHLPPAEHRSFYTSQRFTLNVTRADMIRAGHAPSVRLFEAAACGTPIVSDWWNGLDELFVPEREILIARAPEDTLRVLNTIREPERRAIGRRALERVLSEHTADHRAEQLEQYMEAASKRPGTSRPAAAASQSALT